MVCRASGEQNKLFISFLSAVIWNPLSPYFKFPVSYSRTFADALKTINQLQLFILQEHMYQKKTPLYAT